MFEENQNQQQVDVLLTENIEFRRLYNRHRQLHEQVENAELGLVPMEDLQLVKLKKEKLLTKDRLTRMLEQRVHAH